ncbi:hypothetical protein R0J90_21110, partial [Micrococcus sp. SIMBA_144]
EIYFYTEKLLPVTDHNDYYVNLMDKSISAPIPHNKKITRRSLPKIDVMLEWGVVKAGDVIVAKGKEDEAVLLSDGNVLVK